jgi:hypothetical protein
MNASCADAACSFLLAYDSAAGHGADDQERLGAVCNRLRKRNVRRLVREIPLACKKSDIGPALFCHVIANRASQHWETLFEGVDYRLRSGTIRNFNVNFALHSR